MRITFCCTDTRPEPWLQGLREALPGVQVDLWQPGAPQAEHAVVWAPPQQFFDEQPGLKGIFNIGAGVDALMQRRLPPHQPQLLHLQPPPLHRPAKLAWPCPLQPS